MRTLTAPVAHRSRVVRLAALLLAVAFASAAPAFAQNPRIDRIEPNPIPLKTGVTVRIVGLNFTLRSQVEWNGALITPVVWVSATELRIPLPADSPLTAEPGSATVRVYEQRCTEANQAYCSTYPDLYSNPVRVLIQTPPPSACTLHFIASGPPAGRLNTEYSLAISVRGGAAPYEIITTPNGEAALTEAGLAMTSTAEGNVTITGMLSKPGVFQLPLSARDASGCIVHQVFEISASAGLTVTTQQLADACVGQPYQQILEAAGGLAPYKWYLSGGTTPAGLRVDRDKGTLLGTPLQPAGGDSPWIFYPKIQVDDSSGPQLSAEGLFALTLYPALTVAPPLLEDATFGVSYVQALSATGCKPPYRWSLDAAALRLNGQSVTPAQLRDQAGLVFDESEATWRADPPRRLGTVDFAVLITDASGATARREFRLAIREPRLTVPAASLPDGTVGLPYAHKLRVENGAPSFVWKATGTLPGGITIPDTPQPTAEVELKGTPTKAGTFKFQVRVTDKDGFTTAGSTEFALRIQEAPVGASVVDLMDGAGKILPSLVQDPAGETRLQLRIRNGYARLPLSGTLTVDSFEPTSGVRADQGFASAYQLVRLAVAGSGRSIDFEVPAQGEVAHFLLPAAGGRAAIRQPFVELQAGNVAGNIRLAVSRLTVAGIDITPKPSPAALLTIPELPPQLTRVCLEPQPGAGLAIRITGYSTARDPLDVELALSGEGLEAGEPLVIPDLGAHLLTWFESPASTYFGGGFALQQNLPTGVSTSGLPSVSVTLRKKSTSESATATLYRSRVCDSR